MTTRRAGTGKNGREGVTVGVWTRRPKTRWRGSFHGHICNSRPTAVFCFFFFFFSSIPFFSNTTFPDDPTTRLIRATSSSPALSFRCRRIQHQKKGVQNYLSTTLLSLFRSTYHWLFFNTSPRRRVRNLSPNTTSRLDCFVLSKAV